VLRLLGGLFIAILVVLGASGYGYSNLRVEAAGLQVVEPEIEITLGSVIQGALSLFTGNPREALASIVTGVRVSGTLIIRNPSIVPVYLPELEHRVFLNGVELERSTRTPSMWLGPRGSKTIPYSVFVETDRLPGLLIEALLRDGDMDVQVLSRFSIGGVTLEKKTLSSGNVDRQRADLLPPAATATPESGTSVARPPTPTSESGPVPTPTPSVRPTATPRPRPTSTPRTILELNPTPTPRPTATPTGPGARLTLDRITLLASGDPIGASEVYVVLAVGDGSSFAWGVFPETHYSVGVGQVVDLAVAVEFRPLPAETHVYIGIWEADWASCKGTLQSRLGTSPFRGTLDEFTTGVATLDRCGDDLIGEGSGSWIAQQFDTWEQQLGNVNLAFTLAAVN